MNLRRINILLGSLAAICMLVLYFTVPAAVLSGNELASDEVRAGLKMDMGWRCLGSPSSLFRIHRAEYRIGELAAAREKMQLRCFLERQDETVKNIAGENFIGPLKSAYGDRLSKLMEPAIEAQKLEAVSLALFVKNKTVCYFPSLGEWTQCNGNRRSCLRGACKSRAWLNSSQSKSAE